MITSNEIDKILPALAAVKANLSGVKKGVKNTFFKSSYADLNSHLDVVEPLVEENGLVLLQPVNETNEGTIVSSRIYHVASGQFIESSMKLVGNIDMQKAGSGVTYARRYTLGSLLAMQTIDDDANVAVGHTTKVKTATNPVATNVQTTPTITSVASATSVADRPSFRRPKATVAATTTPVVSKTSSLDDI
jgi:hypothetical protein